MSKSITKLYKAQVNGFLYYYNSFKNLIFSENRKLLRNTETDLSNSKKIEHICVPARALSY